MSIRHVRSQPRHRSAPATRRRGATALKAAAGLVVAGGLVTGVGLPAQAAVPSLATSSALLSLADDYVGTPYVYGGSTPSGFDCSGYTQYVYAKMGISLPHSADAQMRVSSRISAGQAVPGDLVFFVSGGHAYHVGIYAGNGSIYDAPSAGKRVSERRIWTSAVVYGRVLA